MYGLPKGFDGSFLMGRRLELLCFSFNQIILHFNDNIAISIEGSFSHKKARSESRAQESKVPVSESALMQLLEMSVVDVSSNEEGTLTLTFENGHTLECLDDLPNYESYQIITKERTIIV